MQECEGALQALREDKTSLQQEKERLAQDLETCQHQGNEARQQLSAVHQRLSDARDAQGAAKQVGSLLRILLPSCVAWGRNVLFCVAGGSRTFLAGFSAMVIATILRHCV